MPTPRSIQLTIHYHVPNPNWYIVCVSYWTHIKSNSNKPLGDQRQEQRLTPKGHTGEWALTWDVSAYSEAEVQYTFQVWNGATLIRTEPASQKHWLKLTPQTANTLIIRDAWRNASELHPLQHKPLHSLIDVTDADYTPYPVYRQGRLYLGFAPKGPMQAGYEWFLVGSSAETGRWVPQQGIRCISSRNGFYAEVTCTTPFEYKWVCRLPNGSFQWEEGNNRHIAPSLHSACCCEVVHVDAPNTSAFNNAFVIPPRFKGTAIPLFSLRTQASYGCGDLADALLFAQWLHRTGQHVFQLLPIYDTSWTLTEKDSYPYKCITTYGLHPLYLNVRELPGYNNAPNREVWESKAKQLNQQPQLAYAKVLQLKREVSLYCYNQWESKREQDADFQSFLTTNQEQLIPYCLFATLRDRNPRRSFGLYPPFQECLQQWNSNQTVEGVNAANEVFYHAFVQYHLYTQLYRLRQYTERLHILLKGDLPIGVGRESVDVWQAPELFHLNKSAGAPPDAFSDKGQDWGFPTYNWEVMRTNHYAWWKQRLATMARYFSAVRIDHILGFFRIWSIPYPCANACLGHFVPSIGYSHAELTERLNVNNLTVWLHPYLCKETARKIWGANLPQALELGLLKQEKNGFVVEPSPTRAIPPTLREAYRQSVGEVLLVTDEQGQLYPRVNVSHTHRAQQLAPDIQTALYQLHDEYYYQRNQELWRTTALERLTALSQQTSLLLCAEDLGMLPASVGELLKELEILSLEVVRMPKQPDTPMVLPERIPYLSVVTTSTHDTSTLRGWWKTLLDPEKEELCKAYAPTDTPQASAATFVKLLCRTNAMMHILPLQDWCVLSGYGANVAPEQEQINKPEDPNHLWLYRMAGDVETLLQDETLQEAIRSL